MLDHWARGFRADLRNLLSRARPSVKAPHPPPIRGAVKKPSPSEDLSRWGAQLPRSLRKALHPSLDRYGRSLQDPINMVAELRERGTGVTSLHENLDTTTPGGRLVFHVFAALAVIPSSPSKQGCDLGGQVKDTVFDLAA
ncbi:recombinase family protein [Streptomyces sp. NPDC054783]